MLCHCLSLISSSLGKEQLKSGLSLEEVTALARSVYLAAPDDRLGELRALTCNGLVTSVPPLVGT